MPTSNPDTNECLNIATMLFERLTDSIDRQTTAMDRLAAAFERMDTAIAKAGASGEPKITTAQIRAARRQELLALAVALGVREWAESQEIELSSVPDIDLRRLCLDAQAGVDLELN